MACSYMPSLCPSPPIRMASHVKADFHLHYKSFVILLMSERAAMVHVDLLVLTQLSAQPECCSNWHLERHLSHYPYTKQNQVHL